MACKVFLNCGSLICWCLTNKKDLNKTIREFIRTPGPLSHEFNVFQALKFSFGQDTSTSSDLF